jgi:hypothetical protein
LGTPGRFERVARMIRPENAAALETLFTARRFALMLALLIGAVFAPVLFGFQSFIYRDFGVFGHPLAQYFHDSFWRGEIPLWNPLNNCGLPFLAQWNTMVCYPPSLIYLLLPMPWSLNVFCLLHLWFGGLGMYFLARRWTNSNFASAFAGLVFALNGLALNSLMWPNNIAAIGWMPWVLLLVSGAWERGGHALLPAIFAGACQFMTGAPEAFLLTWLVAAVLWLTAVESERTQWLKMSMRFSAVVIGVVALCAVQWLPMFELLRQSQRSANYDSGGWAMPAWGWANLIVPQFRTITASTGGSFQIGQAWTASYYFGVFTLLLAVLGVFRSRQTRVWTLAALVVMSLIFALGNAGFIWPLVKHYVGALGFIRYPVKFVFALAVPLILLASIGLAAWMRGAMSAAPQDNADAPKAISLRVFSIVFTLLLVAIGVVLWFAWQHPLPRQDTAGAMRNGLMRALFFVVLATGFLMLPKVSPTRVRVIAIVWLLIVAADFFTHLPWQNPTVHPTILAPKVEGLETLRERATPGQSRAMLSLAAIRHFHQTSATNLAEGYISQRLGQSQNLNLLEGVAKADGFYSLYIAPEQEVQYRIFPDENTVHPAVADVMAVGFMTTPGKLFEWSARTNPLPMVSAGQQPVFVAESQMLNTILYSNFNPHLNVLLPPEAKAAFASTTRQTEAKVAVEKFGAHEVVLKVNTPAATVVSISQAFYRPWKAYVDDAPISLWRANRAFQAVAVPAGEHRVELRYEDRMFRLGAIISGISLALLLLGRVLLRSR